MSNITIDVSELEKIDELAKKIMAGEAPYNPNRQHYLESLIANQIETAEAITELLEDINY